MKKFEKKIKALKDLELKTPFETHFLSAGEVKKIRFKDLQSFRVHLESDNIVEVSENEEEVKNIPIILPDNNVER